MAKKTLPKGWKLSGDPDDPKKMSLIAADGCKLRYPSEIWRYIKRKKLKLTHSDFAYYQLMTGRQMISSDKGIDGDSHQLTNLTESDNTMNGSSCVETRKRKLGQVIQTRTKDKGIKNKVTVPIVAETRKSSTRLQQKQRQKSDTVLIDQDITQQVTATNRMIRNKKLNNYNTTAEQKINIQKQHNTSRPSCKAITRKSAMPQSHTGQLFPVVTRSKSKIIPKNSEHKEIGTRRRQQRSNVNKVKNNTGSILSTKIDNQETISIDKKIDCTDKIDDVKRLIDNNKALGLRDRSKLIKTFKAKILQEEHTQKVMKPSRLDTKTSLKTSNNERLSTVSRLTGYNHIDVNKHKPKINSSFATCKQLNQLPTDRSSRLSSRQNRTLKANNEKTDIVRDTEMALNIQNGKPPENEIFTSRNDKAKEVKSQSRNKLNDKKPRNITKNTTVDPKIKQNKNRKSAKLIVKNRGQVTKKKEKLKKSMKESRHVPKRSDKKKLMRKLHQKENNQKEVKSLNIKSKAKNPYEVKSGKRIPRHIKGPKWTPPKSPYNLIQEQLFDDPWKLLVATLFLHNVTDKKGVQLLSRFFSKYPTPQIASVANCKEMIESFSSIDMQENRAKIVIKFSEEYSQGNWCYPCELFGIGKYGNDCYRIFCVNEWKKVIPRDYDLVLYHRWLCQEYKYVPRKQPDVLFDYTIGSHETDSNKYKLNLPEKLVPNPINC